MSENGSGAGRPKTPPPIPGQRQAARPPPPPAARKATLMGMPAARWPPATGAKPAPERPQCTLPHGLALRLCRALERIIEADAGLAGAFRIEGDSVFLSREGERQEVSSAVASAGGKMEMRIYFEDLGWDERPDVPSCPRGEDAIVFSGLALPGGEEGSSGKKLTKKAARCKALLGGPSDARLALFTTQRHVFLRIAEEGVFLCAASSRDAQPAVTLFLNV